ncbi:MAG: peptidase [Luteitalea sp.]|nr:peptidase [Luteitalea sp.]
MICEPAVVAAVVAHACEAAPAECCGILLGSEPRIVESVRARNLSDAVNRFLIDPRDHIAARREARTRNLQVVGFYHSHPHSGPTPSVTDIAEVTYDGCLYLIVSLVSEPAVRLFRMNREGPGELPLTVGSLLG